MSKKILFFILGIIVPAIISAYLIQQKFEITRKISYTASAIDIKINPPQKLSPLSTSGRYIVNETGQKVILHGVNLVGFANDDWKWYPKAIENLVKNYKINVVRVRLSEKDYIKDKTRFFENLDGNFIFSAQKNHLYIILSVRPNDLSKDLGDARTDSLWTDVANHYKDNPAILYDLLPEPHDTTFSQIVPRYEKLINIVRAINPKSLIFVTGENWGREINYYSKNPLPYPNIIYRTNPYNESVYFDHQFGQIIKTQPVFIGEFGADGLPYMSREAVVDLINLAKTNDVGWTAWNFYDNGCPCLLSDKDNFFLTPYGQIIKDNL